MPSWNSLERSMGFFIKYTHGAVYAKEIEDGRIINIAECNRRMHESLSRAEDFFKRAFVIISTGFGMENKKLRLTKLVNEKIYLRNA
jgi:hypothetical protein